MRIFLTYLLSLASITAFTQVTGVMQELRTSSVVRRLIATDGLLGPQGNTLPLSPNLLNYSGNASGATFYCHCPSDTTLRGMYYWNVNRWVRFGSDLIGGDTSILVHTVDSTGQLQGRLIFSGRNRKLASSPLLLVDSANSKLVINSPNVSIGTPATKLYVNGRVVTGPLNASSLQLTAPGLAIDTVGQRLMVMDESGIARPLANSWSLIGLPYPYAPNRYLDGYGSFAVLNSDSIAEGSTNRFFTTQRARQSLIGGAGINYDPVTGIIAATGSGGINTLAPIGNSPNVNGASINGSTLTLQPASASFGGVVTPEAQTFEGVKTFNQALQTPEPNTNSAIPSLYLRNGFSAGSRMGIGRNGSQGSMQFFSYGNFRFYGGGDFNDSAPDWLTVSPTLVMTGPSVGLRVGGILQTQLSFGASANTASPSIYISDGAAPGSRTGIGKGFLGSFHSFVRTDNGQNFRWYGGGDFNESATNWMQLSANAFQVHNWMQADANALQVHSSLRLSGAAGYGSINEYTNNQLYIGGSRLDIAPAIFFNSPGWARGRGEMTSNGQVVFSDVSQNNSVAPSAILALNSNSRGFLLPRLTQSQRNAISSPENGLILYDTDSASFMAYNNSVWRRLVTSDYEANASRSGLITALPQLIGGRKTLNDGLHVPNGQTISFGSSAGNAGGQPSRRVVFDQVGTETFDIRTNEVHGMTLNVPTGKRLDIHAGNYVGGVGNIMSADANAISFGAQLNGNFGNFTNTTSNSGGIVSGTGTNQSGFAFNKFAGNTFGLRLYSGETGVISFFTLGSNSMNSSSPVANIHSQGLSVMGTGMGSVNTSSGASSAFTVYSKVQGSTPFPLMTQAERLAIASPAIGLHVYQTDGTEGVYVRKSTGWQFAY